MMASAQAPKNIIQLENIHYAYSKELSLNINTLSISHPESIAVFGDNGSGKSTFLKLLLKLIQPQRGKVQYLDLGKSPRAARMKFGYILHTISLDKDLTVWDNLVLVGHLYNLTTRQFKHQANEYLEEFSLTNKKHIPVKQLSFGMQKKVDIIRALLHQPKILIFDEATTGLDICNQKKFWRVINNYREKQAVTLLYVSHNLAEVKYCSRLLVFSSMKLSLDIQQQDILDKTNIMILQLPAKTQHHLVTALSSILGTAVNCHDKLLFPISDFYQIYLDIFSILKKHGSYEDFIIRKPSLDEIIGIYRRSVD